MWGGVGTAASAAGPLAPRPFPIPAHASPSHLCATAPPPGTAGSTCNLQLNPASDLAGRIAYTLLPIANKGHAGWSYAWVPTFVPFLAASVGAGIMYMSM